MKQFNFGRTFRLSGIIIAYNNRISSVPSCCKNYRCRTWEWNSSRNEIKVAVESYSIVLSQIGKLCVLVDGWVKCCEVMEKWKWCNGLLWLKNCSKMDQGKYLYDKQSSPDMGITDPNGRLKMLSDFGNSIDIDSNIPPRR